MPNPEIRKIGKLIDRARPVARVSSQSSDTDSTSEGAHGMLALQSCRSPLAGGAKLRSGTARLSDATRSNPLPVAADTLPAMRERNFAQPPRKAARPLLPVQIPEMSAPMLTQITISSARRLSRDPLSPMRERGQ